MTHRIHPAERDVALLLDIKLPRFVPAIVLAIIVVIAFTVAAVAHPGDHDHCDQPATGTHKCH